MGWVHGRFARPLFGQRGRAGIGAGVFGLGLVLSSVLAGPVSASTPTTVGYRDFGYGGALATRATSDPEQSKLWYNDGAWWAGLFVSSGSGSGGSHFDIFRLNGTTHSWVDTTRQIDIRDLSHGDYLWDAAHNKLYVASSKSICQVAPAPPAQPCNDAVRVYRYSYNSGAATLAAKYTLDAGFPKSLIGGLYSSGSNFTGGGSNAVTITIDSTGHLWLAYTRDDPTTAKPPIAHFNSSVYLADSADGATWSTPTHFSGASTGQLDQDNTASVVAFGTNVGVYWTDKHASGASSAFFAVHHDSDPVGTWSSPETVTTGVNFVDNQVNLKADSAGKVYAAVKTDIANQIQLFDRSTGGAWTAHNVSTSGNGNTRAQVAIDEEAGLAYVFSSSGGTTDGTIYVKSAPLNTLSFPTGKGAVFIKSASDVTIDDVTLTKQTVSSATGIVAEASDRATTEFLHNEMTLAASDATPPVGSVTINGGAAFTGTADVTLTVPATDAGSGVQLVRAANSNGVDGSGVLNGTGATSMSWAPTVPWTLSAGDGAKTVYVQFEDAAGNWSVPVSDTITLDSTGPVGTVTINAGAAATNSLNVSLDVTATDAGIGTVTNVRIANACTVDGNGLLSDASSVTSPYAATKAWTLASGADGVRTVCAQWQDPLLNWSAPQSDTITLDTTAPAPGTVAIDETSPTSSTTLHLTLTNPGGATNIRIAESAAGIATATPQAYADHVAWPLVNTADGMKTIYVAWEDGVGNDSAPVASNTVLLDTRAPIGHVAINNNNPGIHSLSVTLSFPSTDGDVDQIHVSNSPTMAGAQTFGTLETPFTGTIPWTLPGPLTNYAVHSVYVTFHDITGHDSPLLSGVAYSASDSAKVDLTRPTMSGSVATRLVSGASMYGNSMRLRVSWPAGRDTVTGVNHYRVLVSVDGHAYVSVGIGTTTAASIDTFVAAGHKYRFRVFAVDGAANASNSLYSPTVVAAAYQESNRSLHYSGGWHTSSNVVYYGSAERYSTTRGNSVSLSFTGRSVSWISALGPSRGQARVYVDGVLRATVNLNAVSITNRRVVFSTAVTTGRTHTIKVVVLATSGHPRVDLDAFGVIR